MTRDTESPSPLHTDLDLYQPEQLVEQYSVSVFHLDVEAPPRAEPERAV